MIVLYHFSVQYMCVVLYCVCVSVSEYVWENAHVFVKETLVCVYVGVYVCMHAFASSSMMA